MHEYCLKIMLVIVMLHNSVYVIECIFYCIYYSVQDIECILWHFCVNVCFVICMFIGLFSVFVMVCIL